MLITCSEQYYILPRGGDIIRLFYKTYIFNQLNLCGKAGENNSMPRLIVLKHPASNSYYQVVGNTIDIKWGENQFYMLKPMTKIKNKCSKSHKLTKVCLHFINKAEQNFTQGPPKVLQTQFILESVLSSTTAKP